MIERVSHRVNLFLGRYLDSPFAAVFGVLAILTTLWGMVAIYKDLAEFSDSRTAATVVAGILILLVLFVFISLMVPTMRREYRFPTDARYIFTEINRVWEIDEKGNGVVTSEKTYLFFAEPQDADLHDTVMASLKPDRDDIEYQSEDATPQDHEQVSDVMQRIYWKPKRGEVEVGIPYTHHLKSNFPFEESNLPKYKIMTIAAPVLTVRFNLTVKSRIPIQEVVIFKESSFQRFGDAAKIARRGKRVRRTMAPPPQLVDAHSFTWGVNDLHARAVYYVILYYDYE
ncbi:MAG TPA: hypothetical protein VER08_07115 [Pyrinomonadaceae bacterium]|nr:hypothetical protein [Pyrinomonadaceae bacterium]